MSLLGSLNGLKTVDFTLGIVTNTIYNWLPKKGSGNMKAVWNNKVIAKSDNVIELEGVYYFPVESINPRFLLKSTTKSRCPWKGLAFYYHIIVNNQVNEDACWFYTSESDCPEILKNRIAFWKGVEVRDSLKVSPKLPAFKSLFASFF